MKSEVWKWEVGSPEVEKLTEDGRRKIEESRTESQRAKKLEPRTNNINLSAAFRSLIQGV